ncbi:MAG: hypothetical protein QW594_04015 [Candidatus Woesearchaeota archaeon]
MNKSSKSSSIVLLPSTRSFRLTILAMLCIFLGPRMGQVPLSQCKAQTPVAFLMLLLENSKRVKKNNFFLKLTSTWAFNSMDH